MPSYFWLAAVCKHNICFKSELCVWDDHIKYIVCLLFEPREEKAELESLEHFEARALGS